MKSAASRKLTWACPRSKPAESRVWPRTHKLGSGNTNASGTRRPLRTHKGPARRQDVPIAANVLEAIGNTPLVQLHRVVPPGCARVLVKLEGANPTGNMKDRMAKAAIEAAETSGRLRPGGTVVEYTGGSTGASLALVCAAKGYRLHIVTSDAFSEEKIGSMRALGAEITCIRSDNRQITEKLVKDMIAAAREISQRPGHWWFDQLNNCDAAAGYYPLGEEIWKQTNGKLDAYVQSVGSAHSLLGVAKALRRHNPDLYVAAAEPAESAVLSGKPKGSHRIEGIGIGFVPPLWDPDQVNTVLADTTAASNRMCRRLAREEGIFGGTSSGLNVIAALKLARKLGPDATVVTLIIDSGLRYLSTDVYRNDQ
ncbi:MAG: cysteine synthase family protein [Gammaproteobacteria bacterium]|nr:cysteine synthase family protein [Gammaproteobacteria bacterium]